jgi:outer membrane protein assembly factor BamC
MNTSFCFARKALLPLLALTFVLAACESMGPMGKRIDYKSQSSAPPLEIPPDLASPRYDDRFAVTTASGLAAQNAGQPKNSDLLPTNADARIARGGTERWLVVKATPDQAWATTRQFWSDMGFVLATEQPALGVMETDWAENRADIPQDALRKYVGKYVDVFYTTYKRDKYRTRIERGVEAGTTEIYVSHRGMEQVPTTKIDNITPAAFAWALVPPDPNLEAEMLTRLMMRFGTPEVQAQAAVTPAAAAAQPARARVENDNDGVPKLYVEDSFDRAWRRVGLALDRSGFTVVDRDRSSGIYFVRYSDPDIDMSNKDRQESWIAKLAFWKKDDKDKPEQYRIKVTEGSGKPPEQFGVRAPESQSVVSVQDTSGNPEKSKTGEKILALLKDQLK